MKTTRWLFLLLMICIVGCGGGGGDTPDGGKGGKGDGTDAGKQGSKDAGNGGEAAAGDTGSLAGMAELKMIPNGWMGFATLKPKAILSAPALKNLPKDFTSEINEFLTLDHVARVTFALPPAPPAGREWDEQQMLAMVVFDKDVDYKKQFKRPLDDFTEATYKGKTYLRRGQPKMRVRRGDTKEGDIKEERLPPELRREIEAAPEKEHEYVPPKPSRERAEAEKPGDPPCGAQPPEGKEEEAFESRGPRRREPRDYSSPATYYDQATRTLLVGYESTIKASIDSDGSTGQMMAKQIAKIDTDVDALVAARFVGQENVPAWIKAGTSMMPPAQAYADSLEKLDAVTITASLNGKDLLAIFLEAKDADSAATMGKQIADGIEMGKQMFPQAKQMLPGQMPGDLGKTTVDLADGLVKGVSHATTGNQVAVRIATPAGFNEAVDKLVTQMAVEQQKAVAKMQQMNNLRQIGLAMFNYESTFRKFPSASQLSKDGKPLLSWRVALLPFLEANNLYDRFKMDEPWDSPNNKKLLSEMPEFFSSPGLKEGYTRYVVIRGEGLPFGDGTKSPRPADIRDGQSQTIMAVRVAADKAVPWTKPVDVEFNKAGIEATFGKPGESGKYDVLMFDGAAMRLNASISAEDLAKVLNGKDGESIDESRLFGF